MAHFPSFNIPEEIEIIPDQPVNDSYKCVNCQKLLRDPVQTTCGCRLCKMCAVKILEKKDPAPCPGRSENCEYISLKQSPYVVIDDKATRKDIAKLIVKCPFDCGSRLKYSDLIGHVEMCSARLIQCPYCREEIGSDKLESHEQNCPERLQECKLCHKQYLKKDNSIHFNLQHSKCCDNYSGVCPYCKTGSFTRHTIMNHKDVCSNKTDWKYFCIFDYLNCNETFSSKEQLNAHIDNNVASHIRLSLRVVEHQKNHLHKLTNKIDSAKNEISSLERKCELCLMWAEKCEDALRTTSSFSEVPSEGSLSSSSSRLQALAINGPNVLESIEEVLRQTVLHRGSIFIWRITNYRQLESRADRASRSNNPFSIFSPPFYTSDFGYKVCLRAYPNGDGSGKNDYFSLFIVILAGDYDNIQVWPFNKLVTLTAIDTTSKRNISEKFRADPHSPCFQKPINRRYNVATGCPKFIPKHKLNSFISKHDNGTIYIQGKFD